MVSQSYNTVCYNAPGGSWQKSAQQIQNEPAFFGSTKVVVNFMHYFLLYCRLHRLDPRRTRMLSALIEKNFKWYQWGEPRKGKASGWFPKEKWIKKRFGNTFSIFLGTCGSVTFQIVVKEETVLARFVRLLVS